MHGEFKLRTFHGEVAEGVIENADQGGVVINGDYFEWDEVESLEQDAPTTN